LYSIGVHIGSGSRQESLGTTGAAYLLGKMLTRGTSAHSKASFAEEVESMGVRLGGSTERERSNIHMHCFKNDVSRVVSLLGDAVCNATLDSAEIELAKREVADEHEKNHTDYEKTLIEQAHYNAYREHMMGQPSKGDPDQLQNLNADVLASYRGANFFGDNIVIVATGGVDHDSLVDQVNQAFSSMGQTASTDKANTDQSVYVPALLMIRDDEMVNANVGVFYDAPSVKHEDYYSFMLLKHMLGSYQIDKHAGHLNDTHKQYNSMHALLGELPDVTIHNAHYLPYSDCGLWGQYIFGNEVFVRQMNYCGVCMPTIYSHYVNDVEVIRGRNALYNMLMEKYNNQEVLNHYIGKSMLNLGRYVTRSEIASRVSPMDAVHIKGIANQWFYDAEPSFTNWGAIENTSSVGSYKYFKINTMSTVTNTHHSLFT